MDFRTNLRVLFITHTSSIYEGCNRSLLNMIDGLITKGLNPFVVVPERGGISDELALRKIPHCIIPMRLEIRPHRSTWKGFLLYIPRLIANVLTNKIAVMKISKYARNWNVNIIHSNVGPLFVGFRAAKESALPHFWHLREYQDLDFNMDTLYSMDSFKQTLLDPTNHPVAITRGIRDHFSLGEDSRIIYNGIYPKSSVRLDSNKEKYFLFVGRLTENKGIRVLIEAFSEISKRQSEYKLVVAGDTKDESYKQSLLDFVKTEGLQSRIQFLGERSDIAELMSKAAALVVPSFHEGFGRITAEAMFNGCLVVGYNSGGTKEILEEHNLGLLYSDSAGLISHLESISDKGVSAFLPLIKQAQQHAVDHYSQEVNSEQMYEYYESTIGCRPSEIASI